VRIPSNAILVENCNVTNFGNGFFLNSSSNNTLKENTAEFNSIGIDIDSSSSNTLKENLACNYTVDAEQDNSSSNTFKENTFCTPQAT
jgi:parallel beta-helix repeat protein